MTSTSCQSITDPRPIPIKVLVLGCTGMVGRSWMSLLRSQHIPCVGCARPEFDLMDPEAITRCVTGEYDLVVNAAAWTDVDGAESDEQGATQANADAVAQIARCCSEYGSSLISYSTDYVFSGQDNVPYPVDAPIEPINAYGRSKALGESMLADSGCSSLLIRTSWVYAPWGSNFVRTIRNLAESRDELRVVDDQRGRPTSAEHLAEASLALYRGGAEGIWHLSDEDECSWFDLASEIVRYGSLECRVSPCSSSEYPRPAPRPCYSTLNITDSTRLIGHLGSWKSHLHEVLDAILAETVK